MKKLLLTAALSLLAAVAFANTSSQNLNPVKGWYLGGGIGAGGEKWVSPYTWPGSNSTTNDGLAVALNVGYQFTPYVAIELNGTVLPSKKITAGLNSVTAAYSMGYLAVKGILPLHQRLTLYAKAGLGTLTETVSSSSVDVTTSASNSAFYGGVGAGYMLTHHSQIALDAGSLFGASQMNGWAATIDYNYFF